MPYARWLPNSMVTTFSNATPPVSDLQKGRALQRHHRGQVEVRSPKLSTTHMFNNTNAAVDASTAAGLEDWRNIPKHLQKLQTHISVCKSSLSSRFLKEPKQSGSWDHLSLNRRCNLATYSLKARFHISVQSYMWDHVSQQKSCPFN